MTVSMRVMSAGEGYRYLLKSVAAADSDRDLSTPLTDYYTRQGTPPGYWIGTGIGHLGDGQLRPGDEVTEPQLRRLLGTGRDPISDRPLGHAYPTFPSRQQRIQTRIDALDPHLAGDERAAAVATIEGEESDRTGRRAVAGYDFTFSAPKSVSVLWALAGPPMRSAIVEAHHQAIADVIGLMERQVAATRTGANTTDGAVAQVAVHGVIATAFDHYDSRAGDPQLHTHVVISNKVRTVYDRKWRSLDGRPMHAAVVGLSEHYNTLLADHLTAALGVGWQTRERGRDRNPSWEIAGVPDRLIEVFSTRSVAISREKNRLIEQYRTEHGHLPSIATIIKLREHATIATRPEKTVRSLHDLTKDWQTRAGNLLGTDLQALTSALLDGGRVIPVVGAGGLPDRVVARIAGQVVELVGERRSTWRRWNLQAEASRQTMGLRFATTADRERTLTQIVDAAEAGSLRLTPPELAVSPPQFQRADGSSVFRACNTTVFTSAGLLAAEDRLLDLADSRNPTFTLPQRNLDYATNSRTNDGVLLADDQAAALTSVATSGRVVDVLVGPAGAGKTTAMNALRTAWELTHGPRSVVGLAPSAAAADVLADDLGIETENTAKWLHDHAVGRVRFSRGQLVIIDEASLAGTLALDRLTRHAGEVGAKVLLVGDWAQLSAVQAGGAFGMLVRHRDDVPELSSIHRFDHSWEKAASRQLRHGKPAAIDAYQSRGRINSGDTDDMIDAAYRAWCADIDAGRSSLLIADTTDAVTRLNIQAQSDRISAGHVNATTAVGLCDGSHASTGDHVITRRNNRQLHAGNRWVKNGDHWTVNRVHVDGSLTVQRPAEGGPRLTLPADYVAAHVELGYAVTTHRAQGATVDTAHAIIQPSMTRETLYVAMTRGRTANIAYITTDHPDTEPHQQPHETPSASSVLASVLAHVGVDVSAHDTIRSEQRRWSTIAQLAAEYETIAAAAQHHRWATLVLHSGLTTQQADQVITSPAFGPLCADLRLAEALGHHPDTLMPHLVTVHPLDDADDIASILHHRLHHATRLHEPTGRPLPSRPRLIGGLIPQATGPMTADFAHALAQRQRLIRQRATAVARQAFERQEPWVRQLGRPPHDPGVRREWNRQLTTIACNLDRDRTGPPTADESSTSTRHDIEAVLTHQAARRARQLSMAEPLQTSAARTVKLAIGRDAPRSL